MGGILFKELTLKKIFYLITLSLIVTLSHANTTQSKQIAVHIENLLQQMNSSIDLGIMVQSLSSHAVWYESNADHAYVPASTAKLFTAAAVLKQLGPDYRYHTQLRAFKNIDKGVLHSPLYIRFTGDPRLDKTDLMILIKELKQLGIYKVKGKVYIDDAALSKADYGPGWMWDDNAFCFSGPIGAINLNSNCFHVTIKPEVQPGKQVSIKFAEKPSFVNLSNYAKTKSNKVEDCFLDVHANVNNGYTVRGCMTTDGSTKEWDLAITNPRNYIKDTLRELFAKQNIKISHMIHFGRTPTKLPVLIDHASVPMLELVSTMLKESDNLIAGVLFKTLGAEYYHQAGTWRNGAKALNSLLEKMIGAQANHVVILDGTGLSRYNLITPKAFVSLLDYVAKTPYRESFIAALAIAGVDGTLEERMKGPGIKHHVHAKTGSMTHVSTLAGYLDQQNGETLAFAIMMNHIPEEIADYQKLQDKICQYLRFV